MPRSLLAALVAAVAMAIPAAAAQAAPSLSFDQPCYAEGDPMTYSGAGYTPNGEINFFFRSLSTGGVGTYDTRSDPTGAIAGTIRAPDEDAFISDGEVSGVMGVTANDRSRIDQGAPVEEQFAASFFTMTRWEVELLRPGGGPIRASKPMRVVANGFTRAIGDTLYVQYRRGGKVRRAVKLGRLGGDCGDRTKTLKRALPRGLHPGRYGLMFTTSPRSADGERISFTQRFR
jgi:hypothetical protein